jgi:hypothetical protein
VKKQFFWNFIGFSILLISFPQWVSAQKGDSIRTDMGNISGNFQMDFQYYRYDSLIGTPRVPDKTRMNGFLNLNYTRGNFRMGTRYESYLNPILGFDPRFVGNGIMYRYAGYTQGDLDITVGHFYEQFGTGLTLRSYEERNLGFDNALDGVRLKYKPLPGVYLKGLVGKMRSFFTYGSGIIRGGDGEILLNEAIPGWKEGKVRWSLGGSFVSRYQTDEDPVYKLPQNVATGAGRTLIALGGFSLQAEYAYKINDPSATNNLIYRPGEAAFANLAYSRKGFGFSFSAKRIVNMDFRADRTAFGNNLNVNFLPALTKQHTYRLITLYPYATQPNGEVGFQGELTYTFPKKSALGGKYGTTVVFNYGLIHSLDSTLRTDELGYDTRFASIGEKLYFKDFNVELTKKWSPKFKTILTYIHLDYNKDVIEGRTGFGLIKTQTAIVDVSYKISARKNIRAEIQHMGVKGDLGSWAMGLLEYTIAPKWFVAIWDEFNYGNPDPVKQLHYFGGNVGLIKNGNRITAGYGRQRAGIFCVGGVCRFVPASNGFNLSVTSTF